MGARAVVIAGLFAALVGGCGDEDFKNEPRAPVTVELTGVIQDDELTISPAQLGAGPVAISISNQTDEAQTITLEGERTVKRVGPVPPGDVAELRKSLEPGSYEVSAGSGKAVAQGIKPAKLEIGKARKDSNDELLLP